ncbi:hypothetical protein HWD94_03915 [Pseudarthrobacter equi]|nr:hypothetical protein [Pseudarthrobacter equi]MCT9624269.1 hypothetical protein [Pseudarthrobacter equi]
MTSLRSIVATVLVAVARRLDAQSVAPQGHTLEGGKLTSEWAKHAPLR